MWLHQKSFQKSPLDVVGADTLRKILHLKIIYLFIFLEFARSPSEILGSASLPGPGSRGGSRPEVRWPT